MRARREQVLKFLDQMDLFVLYRGDAVLFFKQMIKIIDALKAAFIYYVYNLHICVYQKISSIVKPFSVDVGRGGDSQMLTEHSADVFRGTLCLADKIIHPHGQVFGIGYSSAGTSQAGRLEASEDLFCFSNSGMI